MVRTLGSDYNEATAQLSRLMQPEHCPDEHLNAVFNALDIDGSGTLEVPELGIALTKLKNILSKAKYGDDAKRVDGVRSIARAFEAALPSAELLEKEQGTLAIIQAGTVASRLGDMLKDKNVDIGDLKNKWDSDGNGKLDASELAQRVRDIGFVATDDEMAELYSALDSDGSVTARPHALAVCA